MSVMTCNIHSRLREKKHEFLHISSRIMTQMDVPLSGPENLMSNPNLIYNTTNGTHTPTSLNERERKVLGKESSQSGKFSSKK